MGTSERYQRYRAAIDHYKANPEMVWSKVNKGDGCWLWTAARNHLGYGQMRFARKPHSTFVRATAVTWELLVGPVPEGAHLLHRCDNPPCVNPAHLFIGTALDNTHDCINKGRFKFLRPRPGVLNNKAKLTWDVVEQIRSDRAAGYSLSMLKRKYGVAGSTLREVYAGRNWRRPGVPVEPKQPPTQKLTSTDVAEIRRLYASGVHGTRIATMFPVSQGHISRLVAGIEKPAMLKTHCKNGHDFHAPGNTAITPEGWRRCRACERESMARARARRRASLLEICA